MLSHEAGQSFHYVGRLNIAGTRFCTATLVSDRLVVTAAHCLYNPHTMNRVPEKLMHFVAGLNRGAHAAARRVVSSHILPEYRFTGRADPRMIGADVALVVLDRPIRSEDVEPVGIGQADNSAVSLAVVSYSKGRPHAPSLERSTSRPRRQGPLMVVDFAVNYGASGSPLLAELEGQRKLIGIVSASASSNGRRVALTVPVEGALRRLKGQISIQAAAL